MSVARFVIPTGGQDTASAPDVAAARRRGPVVRNVLLDKEGSIVSRGGVSGYQALTLLVSLPGFWPEPASNTAGGKLLFARTNNSLQTVLVPGPALGVAFTPFTGLAANELSPTYAILSGYTWGFCSQDIGGGLRLVRWDGVDAQANFILQSAGPTLNGPGPLPTIRPVIAAHLARLFVANAAGPGSLPNATTDRVSLYWSIPGGPLVNALSSWQDPASGLTNKLQLDDLSDEITGLLSWNGRLLIFRRRSTWALYGTSSANFSVRRISDYGCPVSTAYDVVGDAVYWLSNAGLVRYDGATSQLVSGPVANRVELSPANSTPGSRVVRAISSTRLYVLGYSSVGGSWSAIYDTATETWTEFTIDAAIFAATYPAFAGFVKDIAWAGDASGVVNLASLFTAPPEGPGKDAGSGTVERGIPVQIRSQPLPLATPSNKAHIRQVYVDYFLRGVAGRSAPSLTVSLVDDAGTTLWTQTIAGQVGGSALVRQRAVFDAFVEAASVSVIVQPAYTGSDTTLSAIDTFWLLGCSIEYDPAQKRTG